MSRRLYALLLLAIAVAVSSIMLTLSFSGTREKEHYDEAVSAAENMQLCMDAVKAEKARLNIPLAAEDTFETGLIGEEFNFITTTLGDIAAKRTTANPDMAAMLVFMLCQAGLESGDSLGCMFSGSFPALNIAVLCACQALDVKPVYICSCGASTWGANNPELTFPEMAILLYEQGLITTPPALITPGGGDDIGSGVDYYMFSDIWSRVSSLGYSTLREENYSENVSIKKQIFDNADISCFLVSGGNITALGYNMVTDYLTQGILDAEIIRVNDGSGLLELYLHEGMQCILLLNIRQLAADRGFAFDPTSLTKTGEAEFYYEADRPLYILAIGLAAEIFIGYLYFRRRKADAEKDSY